MSEDFTAVAECLQALETTPESRDTDPDTITIMRRALATMSAPKVDGKLIDIQSVNAIVTVYDALARHPQRQQDFADLPVIAMAQRAWSIISIVQRKAGGVDTKASPPLFAQGSGGSGLARDREAVSIRVYCGR